MKKLLAALIVLVLCSQCGFAYYDDVLTSPYDTRNILFKTKKDKYSYNNIDDRDLEYLLSRMEKSKFRKQYPNIDIESRLDRLDTEIFGAIQQGDIKTRLNRLKHAFSANNQSRNEENYQRYNNTMSDFRGFFTSGRPTSIPASPDYYSSMFDGFSAW